MKKNHVMRISAALLVVVLLTTCAIAGTYAKYTTTARGSSSARVAKWAFKVGENALANNFTFKLNETWTDYDGSAESDVSNAEGGLLAPGTAGSFVISLSNESEVNATYRVTFEESFENLPDGRRAEDFPGEYTTKPENEEAWSTNIIGVVASGDIAMNATATITVYWRWAYEGEDVTNDDAYDTALGAAGNVNVKITATVVVTQQGANETTEAETPEAEVQ